MQYGRGQFVSIVVVDVVQTEKKTSNMLIAVGFLSFLLSSLRLLLLRKSFKCDLILLDAPAFNHGMGITIQVRTTMRYGKFLLFLKQIRTSVNPARLWSCSCTERNRMPEQ